MNNFPESTVGTVLTKIISTAAIACLLNSSFALADEDRSKHSSCLLIDLRNGTFSPPPRFIEFVVPPEDFNQDGWYETVLKITLNDPARKKAPAAASFFINYDGDPSGITVDIGDSGSNDGGSGDDGDQSNDAEVQVGSVDASSSTDDMFIFGHDGILEARGTQLIDQVLNIVKAGETLVLLTENERVAYRNKAFPISGDIRSSWLYALNGQPDTEGPVNYDIYAAFNRVVNGNYRIGSGVGKVTVCLLPPHARGDNSKGHDDLDSSDGK